MSENMANRMTGIYDNESKKTDRKGLLQILFKRCTGSKFLDHETTEVLTAKLMTSETASH